jgi:glyoxylase-like metal-dependent hydrolase (beta-lactamase superfamily II)
VVSSVDVLIPTARFVFSVAGDHVEVSPEHRSPEAFVEYGLWLRERAVTGMTTFPNSLLVRGSSSFLVDPGLQLQNAPIVRALEQRGLGVGDLAFVALTHAHADHAAALVDLPLPVVVHERETSSPHWGAVEGILARRELRLLRGDSGELVPGVRWARTPGHTPGSVSYAIDTPDGVVVACGDIIGPSRRPFDEMAPEGPDAAELLSSWELIRAWRPARVIGGHLPPFAP